MASKHSVKTTSLMEQEQARMYCGLTHEQYDNLVGTHYWASDENAIGIYECKSDVLVYYRAQKLIEAIINDLNMKDIKNKK